MKRGPVAGTVRELDGAATSRPATQPRKSRLTQTVFVLIIRKATVQNTTDSV